MNDLKKKIKSIGIGNFLSIRILMTSRILEKIVS